jgi:hypothetical protein
MATVDKNFRIKNGLVVEGATATVNGNDILTKDAGDSYIINLIGGTATSANTPSTVVKRDANGNFEAGTLALTGITVQDAGSIFEDSGLVIQSNSGYSIDILGNQDVTISSSNGDINLNPDGSAKVNGQVIATRIYADDAASTAQANAASDATTKANAAQLAAETTAALDATSKANQALSDAQAYAQNAANAAQSNAEFFATSADSTLYGTISADIITAIANEETARNSAIDSAIMTEESARNSAINTAITTEVSDRNSAIATAKNQAIADANSYTDGKVADLVDSAPELLDTLNELAAAIADNPNYASDVANLVATKADTTYVDSEISDLDAAAQGYANTAQSNAEATASADATTKANAAQAAAEATASADATTKANAAQAAAEATASADATTKANAAYDNAVAAAATDATDKANTAQSNAEATAQTALNSVLAGDTSFTEVSIDWMVKHVGSYAYQAGTTETVAYSWNHNAGASAKFLVRIKNGIHSQVSEVLLTRDDANNIAITEYGMVTTNGILGDITAAMNQNNIDLKVTPAHNTGTEIFVSGTLLRYAD